jgi:hypothetical protein
MGDEHQSPIVKMFWMMRRYFGHGDDGGDPGKIF